MRFRTTSFVTAEMYRYLIYVGDPVWKNRRLQHVTFPNRFRAWCWTIKDPDDPKLLRVALL